MQITGAYELVGWTTVVHWVRLTLYMADDRDSISEIGDHFDASFVRLQCSIRISIDRVLNCRCCLKSRIWHTELESGDTERGERDPPNLTLLSQHAFTMHWFSTTYHDFVLTNSNRYNRIPGQWWDTRGRTSPVSLERLPCHLKWSQFSIATVVRSLRVR